jgi:hypothetical protein
MDMQRMAPLQSRRRLVTWPDAVCVPPARPLDPFGYIREVLSAPCALRDSPGEEALAHWLPGVWQKRQRKAG